MKRLLCFLSLLISVSALADTVSESTARKVAEGFFGIPSTKSGSTLKLINGAATKAVSSQNIYIYTREGGGFIGVAGDDALNPVMFYSTTGDFVLENIPENIQCVLDDLAGCVEYARQIKLSQTTSVASKWQSVQNGVSPVMQKGKGGKYLETPRYNQSSPYWDDCPMDGSSHTYSGCVATATAEIMKFHEWPVTGTGTIPSYYAEKLDSIIAERPLGHKYDWDNILTYYRSTKGYSDSGTDQQRANIAQLLFDIGCMVEMDYGTSGSGAVTGDAAIGLAKYMGYCGDVYHRSKSVYSAAEWIAMIKESIDNGLPVLYSGRNSSNGGHAFVADGYDEDDNIHINFGWGGTDNAYYTFPVFDSYSLSHGATFNLRPNKNGTPDVKVAEVYIHGISSSVDPPVKGTTFTITIDHFAFSGNTDLNTTVAAFRTDGGGNPVEKLATKTFSLESGYYYSTNYIYSNKIQGDIAVSDYVSLYYHPVGSSDWVPVLCNTEEYGPDRILLGTQAKFEAGTVASFDNATKIFKVTSDKYTKYTVTKSGSPISGTAYSASNGVLSIDTTKLSSGTYKVKAEVGSFSKEFNFVL